MAEVALKRPAVSHLLATGDAGLSDPGEHEALGEAVLGHARHVPCPEQRATREVVLEREDPGALLGALGGDAVDERLAHGDAAYLADPLVVPVVAVHKELMRVSSGAWGLNRDVDETD